MPRRKDRTKEELSSVNGGVCGSSRLVCPVCGASSFTYTRLHGPMGNAVHQYTCKQCGHAWQEIEKPEDGR